MNRSIPRYSILLMMLLAWCGCEHDHYEIEIIPEGEAFQRRLTCWHANTINDKEIISSLSAHKLAALAKLYPQRETSENADKQVFTGRFTNKTPGDIGGAGEYTCYTTPLGSALSYVERFRGNDDLATQIDQQMAKRHKAADQLVDLLVGWMTAEIGKDPNFPKLKKFLDKDLRRDLHNLAAYSLTFRLIDESHTTSNEQLFVRVGQYFFERGYFSTQDIPMFRRVFSDDDPKTLLVFIQRFLSRKMGIADDQPIPASLNFLNTLDQINKSYMKYVRSPEFPRKHNQAPNSEIQDQKQETGSTENTPAEGADMLLELALDVLGFQFNLFGTNDFLRVTLFSGTKPYITNGEWNKKTATVVWDTSFSDNTTDRLLPVICYAFWSTPNSKFQEKHFGKIFLAESDLAKYAIWYRSLKPQEAKEWDQFLDGLKPGPDLAAVIKAFRFSTDPKPDPNNSEHHTSLADMPRNLILEALEAAPDDTQ